MSRVVKIYRYDPCENNPGKLMEYEITEESGMSIMDVLDYVYFNLDSSLSYFSHSRCKRGICSRCAVKLNGKNTISCQTPLPENGEVIIEPINKNKVLKDLIVEK
jgi:succinate dehydrogenase/fumarate reductase-like Fe-S protein